MVVFFIEKMEVQQEKTMEEIIKMRESHGKFSTIGSHLCYLLITSRVVCLIIDYVTNFLHVQKNKNKKTIQGQRAEKNEQSVLITVIVHGNVCELPIDLSKY